jgi:putative oxidoreductase
MGALLGRYSEYVYAIFRIVFGLLFMMHGTQKMFNWPAPGPPELSGLPYVAGVLELTLGFLILIGLFGSLAAFIAAGEMAVAYFMVHQPGGFWPLVNHGELAVMFCFAFLYVAAHGSGVWSVDSLMRGTAAAVSSS